MHTNQLETLFLIGTNRLAAIINRRLLYLFHVSLTDRLMTRITSMIKYIGLHSNRLRTGATNDCVERLRNDERSKGNLFVYSYDTCIHVIHNLAMSHQNRYSSSVFFVPPCKNHQERIVCSSMSCCVFAAAKNDMIFWNTPSSMQIDFTSFGCHTLLARDQRRSLRGPFTIFLANLVTDTPRHMDHLHLYLKTW